MTFFQSRTIPVDSLFLKNPTKNLDNYLSLRLEVFPSGKDRLNRTGISTLGYVFSNQDYKPNNTFGPCYFIADNYGLFASDFTKRTNKSSSTGIATGAAAGGCVVVLLLPLTVFYAFCQKRRAERATQQSNAFGL